MTSVFSWQNSISHCPASFCTPRLNLPVTPGVPSEYIVVNYYYYYYLKFKIFKGNYIVIFNA